MPPIRQGSGRSGPSGPEASGSREPRAEGPDDFKSEGLRVDEEFDVLVPDYAQAKEYVDGFGLKAMLGGFFVGFLIAPASMYMRLMIGGGLGGAAQWVTVIIFLTIARQIRTPISKQEYYLIFHIAGGVMGVATGGEIFSGFIWTQFLVQSNAAKMFEIADQLPLWVAPPPESDAYKLRSLLHRDWWPHLTIMGVFLVWGRLNFYSLGYAMFRIISDVERLPFPMAPIAVEGITALAESDKETWRWRVFSIGAAIGMGFALLYAGIPLLTGLVFDRELKLIEIPFYDYTKNTEKFLPAVPLLLPTHLGQIFTGFVLPFWMIIGSAIAGLLGQLIANPILYKCGVLRQWEPGMSALETGVVNRLDFWMAFGIGTGFAVAFIGFYQVGKAFLKREKREGRGLLEAPKGRGDIPISASLLFYAVSTSGVIMIAHYLVPKFPVWIMIVFAFGVQPFMYYISARLQALTGHSVGIPYIRETVFLLTGYKGIDVWYAPIPLGAGGGGVQGWRQMELSGTRFTSFFKAQLFEIPLAIGISLLFWSFIWRMGEIPSSNYPHAMKFWPINAVQHCFWRTATTSGNEFFLGAINKPLVIATGLGVGTAGYVALASFKLPVLLIYGVIRGFMTNPLDAVPEVLAACFGRYYLSKKFGRKRWRRYSYVLAAGFGCGVGLMIMACTATRFIKSAVSALPF